jgi:hypothetical protein
MISQRSTSRASSSGFLRAYRQFLTHLENLYNLFLQKRCVDTYAFRGRIEVGVGLGKVKMALLILPFRGRIEVGVGVTWRPSR